MKFDLRLSIDLKPEFLQVQLSPESLLIVSVIKYCGVFSRDEIRCVCFYSKKDLIEKSDLNPEPGNSLENCLRQLFDKSYNNITQLFDISFCDMDELNQDTTLPCLVRKFTDNCSITITGLASLFRDLIKTASKIKPGFELESLLVNSFFYKFIISFSI